LFAWDPQNLPLLTPDDVLKAAFCIGLFSHCFKFPDSFKRPPSFGLRLSGLGDFVLVLDFGLVITLFFAGICSHEDRLRLPVFAVDFFCRRFAGLSEKNGHGLLEFELRLPGLLIVPLEVAAFFFF